MASRLVPLTLLALATLGSAGPLVEKAACNADNCARAVTGTAQGLQSAHLADCSSFFLATVTPAASTTTVTITPAAILVTTTVTTLVVSSITTVPGSSSTYLSIHRTPDDFKRGAAPTNGTTIFPSSVPTYASALSGTSRYSSACSCGGVKKSTTTAAAATVTSTVTAAAPTLYIPATATTAVESIVTAPAVAVPVEIAFGLSCNDASALLGPCATLSCNAYPVNATILATYTFGEEEDCWYSLEGWLEEVRLAKEQEELLEELGLGEGEGGTPPDPLAYFTFQPSGGDLMAGECVIFANEPGLTYVYSATTDILKPMPDCGYF